MKHNRHARWIPEEIAYLTERFREGITIDEIAKEINRTRSSIISEIARTKTWRRLKPHWPKEDVKLLRKLYKSKTLKELAIIFKKDMYAVGMKANDLGLRKRSYKPWRTKGKERVKQEYGRTPTRQLARELGRDPRSIYSLVKQLHLHVGGDTHGR